MKIVVFSFIQNFREPWTFSPWSFIIILERHEINMAAQQPNTTNQTAPAKQAVTQAETPPPESAQVSQSNLPKILIVEDDPILGRMYSEKFKSEGYDVVIAQDGESGLVKAKEGNLDVILLDVMLPRMSGIDLLEELRKDSRGKNINVVALTNLADQSEKDRAIALGVKDYLVKAMQTPEQVVQKVNSILGKK